MYVKRLKDFTYAKNRLPSVASQRVWKLDFLQKKSQYLTKLTQV